MSANWSKNFQKFTEKIENNEYDGESYCKGYIIFIVSRLLINLKTLNLQEMMALPLNFTKRFGRY